MKRSALLIFLFASLSAYSQHLKDQVTIRRTDFGVPHILANDLRSASFGLAYAELEDRGEAVILPLIRAKGILSRYTDVENVDRDFYAKLVLRFTKKTYPKLEENTKEILEGFAAGVNYYLEKHPEQFPEWYYQDFTGIDIAATSNRGSRPVPTTAAREFLRKLEEDKKLARQNADVGSNAWAFAPERTKSGKAILMRNPHLSWDAGYYEAQITIPGLLNFYGDFRIGGMFAIICGFNEHLGWATTNNHPDLEEVYALKVDPEKPDHYILDGNSYPIQKESLAVEFKNGDGIGLSNREWMYTPYGPVIERSNGFIYIVKTADWNNYRRGEQLTAMLLSKNLDDFKNAMKMRYVSSSNYTYADAEGNIYYIWNASTPKISNDYQGDTVALAISSTSQIWSEFQDFENIPQFQNPDGGYLQNSNDPFYFTNVHEPYPVDGLPQNYPKPNLRTRSQHSLKLIDNDKKFSLEDIVKMKHSMRALTAERMKDDLVKALRLSEDVEVLQAADHLEQWDGRFAAESRGSVLFYQWFWIYANMVGHDSIHAVQWDIDHPVTTPYGLGNPDSAVVAMKESIANLTKWFGTYDLPHGEVYRVRRGKVDAAVGGGTGAVGNFRVLWFEQDEDKKYRVVGGDGWVFAVEFGEKIKAYSILAYGQSNDPENPHFDDQAEMFANNRMKKVAYSEKEIKKALIRAYKPGQE